MILEARCSKCGESFCPNDEADLIHLVTESGDECGGFGTMQGAWGALAEHVNVMVSDDDEAHALMIDFLTGGEPTGDAVVLTLLRRATQPDLTALRLAWELCPVHHCDAAICEDDGVGDGGEHCGSDQDRCGRCGDTKRMTKTGPRTGMFCEDCALADRYASN